MYIRLNNYEYKVTSASVGFDMAPDNKSLLMFIDISGEYEKDDLDCELKTIRLYHNNGFNTGVKEPKKLIGKRFEWTEPTNNKNEEAGTFYVLEHEEVTSGVIEISDVTADSINIKWTGLTNVFWDEEFDENVPFKAEIEAKLPAVPKTKVIDGFKKTKLKIDRNTEIELLNFPEMVNEVNRCTELWRNNDRSAWSTFDKALKLKLTYMGKEYFGEAVYKGEARKCTMVLDNTCPLNVQIVDTHISDNEYKFYFLVEPKQM